MKNKLTVLLLLFTVTILRSQAQSLTDKEIVGTWKVVKINMLATNLPPEVKTRVDSLKKTLLKTSFSFKTDHNFTYDWDIFRKEFKQPLHWKLNPASKEFTIQEWKDKDTNKSLLMGISARKQGDKVLFNLAEMMFELEVQKQ